MSQSTSAVRSSHGIRRIVARSGDELEVAVALLPVGHPVARDRVHLHVEREQVVARLDAVVEHLVDEVVAVDALAHQPALHVGEAGEDGVDLTCLHRVAQGGCREHALRLALRCAHAGPTSADESPTWVLP